MRCLALFVVVWQITAVLLAIAGIVLMAYAEGFGGPNATGVILSVSSAVGAAIYKVFKPYDALVIIMYCECVHGQFLTIAFFF